MAITISDAVKQLESKYGADASTTNSSLSTRTANSTATTQRMGLGDASNTPGRNDFSASQAQSTSANNNAVATSPYFQRSVAEDNRNFKEDTRRFDATLGAKSGALADEQSTNRYQSDNQLSGVKYNADAGVKSTGLQADASKYGADRGLDAARIGADANRYGADRGVDQARIGATAQVDSARIGADASRFNALLGAGTTFFNSSQYRPTFNR
jgi:hypothetical protein